MIPKIIHYCWFGGNPKSELINKCIVSWRKYCPDYVIKEWNETNFTTDNLYFNQALDKKKWSFASDYARLEIIYREGGIYLDTDVELIKSPDFLLDFECFVGTERGREYSINTGLGFGAESNHKMLKEMICEYKNISFEKKDGTYDETPCPVRNTCSFKRSGYDTADKIILINNAAVLPPEYLSPKNYLTREVNITPNTVSIHHYDGGWLNSKSKILLKIKEKLNPRFNRIYYRLRGIHTN